MDKRGDTAYIDELVIRCQQGEKDAFAGLYDVFVDPLYRYVYYRCKAEDVEDLLELIFIKAWEHIGKYKKTHSFQAWIFRIAHNTVIDYYRTHKRIDPISVDISDTDDSKNPVKSAEKTLESALVHAAIRSLKEPYKHIVTLRFIEDLDYDEIAHIIGKSEGTIRVMVHRALAKLRTILKSQGITF